MKSSQLLSLAFVFSVICGCGKQSSRTTQPADQPNLEKSASVVPAETTPTAPPPPPPLVATATAAENEPQPAAADTENEGRDGFLRRVYSSDHKVAIHAMNQLIQGRSMTATTELKSLEQLVAEGGLPRMPKAQAGFRYVLDPKTKLVILTQ